MTVAGPDGGATGEAVERVYGAALLVVTAWRMQDVGGLGVACALLAAALERAEVSADAEEAAGPPDAGVAPAD